MPKLPTNEKWQLVQTLLSAIQFDTTSPQTTTKKTYPLRGLPITISDDFDEPMPELWEANINTHQVSKNKRI